MSDLPADSLGYQAVVAEFFLALRGAGLLLSPLDQELVAEWERRGLPVPVVCRGIRRGMTEVAEERRAPVRSLRSVRHVVEDEWRAYRSGRVGDAPGPPDEEELARERLADARRRLVEAVARGGPLAAVHRVALDALDEADALPGAASERMGTALAAADARLLSGWLASLPRAERSALGARVLLLAGARRTGESRRAYRKSLRAHLLDLAGRAGLTWLGGSV